MHPTPARLLLGCLVLLSACTAQPPVPSPLEPAPDARLEQFEGGVWRDLAALERPDGLSSSNTAPFLYLNALVLSGKPDTVRAYLKTTHPSSVTCRLDWGDSSATQNLTVPTVGRIQTFDHVYTSTGAVTLTASCSQGGTPVGSVQRMTVNVAGIAPTCAITGVTLSGPSGVAVGSSVQYSATVNKGPAGCVGAVSQAVTWQSGDTGKATVSGTGLVTGVAESAAVTLTATSTAAPAFKGTATVQVTPRVWDAVTSGETHNCALSSGSVYCWGRGDYGQLGNGGTARTNSTPVKVSDVAGVFSNTNVTAVSAGRFHTCAVSSGSVYCWGWGHQGQLGYGSDTNRWTPVKVSDGVEGFNNVGITAVSSGEAHTCAISSGSVYCWGFGRWGQLGNSGPRDIWTPAKVSDVPGVFSNVGVTAVSAGRFHTCAVSSGSVYCWGEAEYGQLGNGDTTDTWKPVKVSDVPGGFSNVGVTAVSGGYLFTCAISSGSVYCWGQGSLGQLGYDSGHSLPGNTSTPIKVANGTNGFSNASVTAVATGGFHTCALSSDSVYCWGNGAYGQLGYGDIMSSYKPFKVSDGVEGFNNASVTAVSGGYIHTCAISSGRLYCWGSGDTYGALGNGSTDDSLTPVKVSNPLP